MAEHNDMGKEGEELAAKWLEDNGYTIVHRNWRYRQFEIDIIAGKGKYLHFFEVKSRAYYRNSFPEQGVTRKKFRFLQKAADEYLFRHPGHPWIQYNILAVTFHKNKKPEIFLIEDVYFYS